LAEFGGRRKLTAWNSFDNAQLRTFAAALLARASPPRSIQRHLSAARTFYEYLMREGHCARNPALDVRAPKPKKRLPATLDADQMGRLSGVQGRRFPVPRATRPSWNCSTPRDCGWPNS